MGREEDRAAGGQGLTGPQFRLGVGQAKAGGGAHHLTGAAHLGTQDRVSTGEALEGEHRLLHRLQRGLGLAGQTDLLEGFAGHDPAGDLGQGGAGGLGHEGHRAGGAGVGLNDVDEAVLDRELQVDQSVDLKGQGQGFTPLADRREGLLLQAHRGQGAGGVTGVDAGRFDVLHQTADDHLAGAIAEGIDIHLGGVLEVLVNQNRVIRLDVHRFVHVAVELVLAVDHLHGPAAQDIAGAHHHGIADAISHHPGLGLAAGQAIAGLTDVEAPQDRFELLAVLRGVDRFRRGAPDAGARGLTGGGLQPVQQRNRQLQRGLAAELNDHALGLLRLDDVQHILKGEGLEVEAIRGVVVG